MARRRRRAGLLAGLAALALAGSVPGTAVGQAGCTPNDRTNAADPGLIAGDGGYALVATDSNPLTIPIRRSDDGSCWRPAGAVFSTPPSWIAGGIAAPDFAPGGEAVTYGATRRNWKNHKCIGVAVLASGGYKSVDRLCRRGVSLIDPTIFVTRGKRYLLYKTDLKNGTKRIVMRPLRGDFKIDRSPKRRHMLLKPELPWEGRSVEAPTMVYRAGKYYLFYSGSNFTTRDYGVGVARSDKGVTGPFKRLGKRPIIGGAKGSGQGRCGVGHQDVTRTKRDGWRIYYHYGTQSGSKCVVTPRYLEFRRLIWRKGGPKPGSVNAATATTGPAAAKTCVGHPSDASIACVRNGGRTLDVCDRDRDGHRAYARVVTEASSPRFQSPFYDTNGSKAGCANLPFTSRIVSVAVCVQSEGCSAFKPTGVAAAPPAPQAPPPPPARPPARDVCAAHPSDASVACVRNSGHTVDVCDRDADGHRAYARVITDASSPSFLSPFYDGNDSQPGCANVPFPSRVLSVAICVQFESCSAFKPT